MANDTNETKFQKQKRNRAAERSATFGLLLVCVALVAPFAVGKSMETLSVYKWIYSAGALVFLMARLVGAADSSLSKRLRRIKRMEFWAGAAFAAGAFMWFHAESRLGPFAGPLAVLHNTIMFTLAGAVIQIVAVQLAWSVSRKEGKEDKK